MIGVLITVLALSVGLEAAAVGVPITVNATCDNTMTFYADGVQMTGVEDADWTRASFFTLPACTKTIAIYCLDLHVIAGILASVSDGTVTDASWKCTNVLHTGWETSTYDDTAWSGAHVILPNDGSGGSWNVVHDIDENANWVWTSGWTGTDKNVYCRKTIDACDNVAQGYDCTLPNSPCTPANIAAEDFYHPHTNSAMFVQCDEWGGCFEMSCPGGLVWNDAISACDWP